MIGPVTRTGNRSLGRRPIERRSSLGGGEFGMVAMKDGA